MTGSIVEYTGSTVEVNGIEELAGIVEFTAIVDVTGIVEVEVEVIRLVEGTGSSVVETGADVVCEEHDADSSPTAANPNLFSLITLAVSSVSDPVALRLKNAVGLL